MVSDSGGTSTVNEITVLRNRIDEIAAQLGEALKIIQDLRKDVEKLGAGLESLQKEVGKLAESYGHIVEEIARWTLPDMLSKRLGVKIGELKREFYSVDGKVYEIDFHGVGEANGYSIEVFGEVKTRIHGEDVKAFYEKIARIKNGSPSAILVLYGLYAHPTAIEEASKRNIIILTPYYEYIPLNNTSSQS
ncbi:hypothetical protein ACSU1N_06710 [Thermogladius sp. 4427co]|uniref:hypothetical protein n=1 Tax=Thermogladius sp. 4427co TaxID=3450718 RepID=UPI003F7AD95A